MHPLHDAPPSQRLPTAAGLSAYALAPHVAPSAPLPSDPRAASPGLEALGRALATHPPEALLACGPDADVTLRTAARLLAAEARAADPVRAERLVVALRPAYGRLIEIDGIPASGPGRAIWDRLVRLCCEEFYTPVRGGA